MTEKHQNPAELLPEDEQSEQTADVHQTKDYEKGRKKPSNKAEVSESSEGGTLHEITEQREKTKNARPKPDKKTLESQGDKITETFREVEDEDQATLIKEALLAENPEMTDAEFNEIYDSIADIVKDVSPEFAEYLVKMLPELKDVIGKCADMKNSGNERGALNLTVEFLQKQQGEIEKIQDPQIRDQLLGYLSEALNTEQISKDLKDQAKLEIIWGIVGLAPVLGPAIDIGSAAVGKTPTGEILDGKQRIWFAVKGVGFMALDIAGLVTLGETTAAAEAARVAKVAEVGAEVGKVTMIINKFRGLVKTIKASQTALKLGRMAASLSSKYPKITRAIEIAINVRAKTKTIKRAAKVTHLATRTIVNYNEAGKVARIGAELEREAAAEGLRAAA
jgi:hypothetical protein